MKKEPKEPLRRIKQQETAVFDFNWATKKVALSNFMEWCKKEVPVGAENVTLELVEDWQYDDCLTSLELSWEREIDNPHYEKEFASYLKKMKKWEKQC